MKPATLSWLVLNEGSPSRIPSPFKEKFSWSERCGIDCSVELWLEGELARTTPGRSSSKIVLLLAPRRCFVWIAGYRLEEPIIVSISTTVWCRRPSARIKPYDSCNFSYFSVCFSMISCSRVIRVREGDMLRTLDFGAMAIPFRITVFVCTCAKER